MLISTFLSFYEYSQQFAHIRFEENLSQDDYNEQFHRRSLRLQKLRKALRESEIFSDIEQVQLLNLAPQDVEDAVAWIPSLEPMSKDERAPALKKCIDLIQKTTNMLN